MLAGCLVWLTLALQLYLKTNSNVSQSTTPKKRITMLELIFLYQVIISCLTGTIAQVSCHLECVVPKFSEILAKLFNNSEDSIFVLRQSSCVSDGFLTIH